MRSPSWENEILHPPFRPNANHSCPKCKRYAKGFRIHQSPKPSSPSLGSWLDGPKFQGPSSETIGNLQSASMGPASTCPCISIEKAYSLAYREFHDYNRKTMICLDPSKSYLYPRKDLPFKVFEQLDKELFRSVLKGNIYLAWSSKLSPNKKGITFPQNQDHGARIAIKLATSLQDEGSRLEILATLVHQMIHAYFLQCCGYRNKDDQNSGYDLGHGFEFQGLLRSIEHRFRPDLSRYLWNLKARYERPPGGRWGKSNSIKYCLGGSNCADIPDYTSNTKRIDCKQWCHNARAIADSLAPPSEPQQPDFFYFADGNPNFKRISRSEYGDIPLETYIEIHFDAKVFPFNRNEVFQNIEGLAKSPVFTNNRVLTLPPTSNPSDLIALSQFLQEDTNEEFLAQNSFPAIDPDGLAIDTQMIDSISAYYLGLNISFPPFVSHSFLQLSSPSMTSYPIEILDAIYCPQPCIKSPDPLLRRWARSWLSERIPENAGLYPDLYLTNLGILQEHPRYKPRYQELREKCTLLAKDVDVVQASIKENAEPKRPKILPIAQRPLVAYHYPPAQDPRHQPYAPHPFQIWQNGVQQPVQTEQAHPPAAVQFFPNGPQAVGQAALPAIPYQNQHDTWGIRT